MTRVVPRSPELAAALAELRGPPRSLTKADLAVYPHPRHDRLRVVTSYTLAGDLALSELLERFGEAVWDARRGWHFRRPQLRFPGM